MILPSNLPTAAEERLKVLKANRAQMIEYIKLKLSEDDLHGVADGAMDVRDLDSEIKGIEFMRGLRSQPL
jgi:hypothetical protein